MIKFRQKIWVFFFDDFTSTVEGADMESMSVVTIEIFNIIVAFFRENYLIFEINKIL